MPTALLWLALLAATAALLVRGERKLGWICAGASLAYWLANSTWIAVLLLVPLEADYVDAPLSPARPFDAVLVLGGGTAVGPHGRPQLSHSGDRVATAAAAYHRGDTALLVCSGTAIAALSHGDDRSLAHDTRDLLAGLGVPESHVRELPGPRNTSEEMRAFAELAKSEGWQHLGVITSAWHMRRALGLARAAGLDLTPIPADFRGGSIDVNLIELLPSAQGAYFSRLAIWEYLGRAVGR
jgi:uncharacterized SAM-binding protein YcdF (DUF218 family)